MLAVLLSGNAWAQPGAGVLPVPPLTARVIDQTGTLSSSQVATLEARLAAIEAKSGSQVVVLMVPTTAPEDIAAYANRIGNDWKIGRKDVGDGVLLIVAKNDRRVRIEVAKALEGAIPDLAARQIIDQSIAPRFKAGDYASGLNEAVDRIAARIAGEGLPAPDSSAQAQGDDDDGFSPTELAMFAFFAVPILFGLAKRIFGRPLGSVLSGAGVGALMFFLTASVLLAGLSALAGLLFALFTNLPGGQAGRGGGGWSSGGGGGWSSGGGGGWSSGGGGGGGFSSGGGGDFGGGGASGDW